MSTFCVQYLWDFEVNTLNCYNFAVAAFMKIFMTSGVILTCVFFGCPSWSKKHFNHIQQNPKIRFNKSPTFKFVNEIHFLPQSNIIISITHLQAPWTQCSIQSSFSMVHCLTREGLGPIKFQGPRSKVTQRHRQN